MFEISTITFSALINVKINQSHTYRFRIKNSVEIFKIGSIGSESKT